MNIATAIMMYIIIWWLTLFAVLPFRQRNQAEHGAPIVKGTDPGAPAEPRLLRKLAWTTVLATLFFGIYAGLSLSGAFNRLLDLPR